MLEAEGGSAATLEEFAGASFGDFSSEAAPEPTPSTTPETPAPVAGAVADPSAGPVVPSGSTPEPTAEPLATPADAASPDPITPVVVADDPLKDAAPITYQVDGETKSWDGIKLLGDAGGIIAPEFVKEVAQRLSERDHLLGANQKLYATNQQYEALGGPAKFAEVSERLASVNAVGAQLLPLFAGDVNGILKYLVRDAEGNIGWNEDARTNLLDRLTIERDKASGLAKASFQASATAPSATQGVEQVRASAVQMAMHEVRKAYEKAGWTAADFTAAEQHITRHHHSLIRTATAEDERKYNGSVKAGQTMIDYPLLGEWASERQALREGQARTATTVSKSAEENAKRLVAALPGTTRTAPAPVVPAKPAQQQAKDSSDSWDMMERLAASSIRAVR